MHYQLRISGKHYQILQHHLFPGDGKEAVAVVLCGRHEQDGLSILLTHKIKLIPHEECKRDEDYINWKTDCIVPLLEEAEKSNMAILKIHSHPGGYEQFSDIDNESDSSLFTSVFGWCDSDSVHASAIMLPTGEIFGRVFTPNMESQSFNKVSVAGHQIMIWDNDKDIQSDDFSVRTVQAFGEGTYSMLKKLKIGVIGCSGTGSPTIEQLSRLGIGTLVIVDPDIVEKKNLNRILNTTIEDAKLKRYKTEVLESAINKFGLGTKVITFNRNLYDSKDSLLELITCDIIIGCVDSVDGRHLISQLTNFYHIPYFDLGVRLKADGKGNIDAIVASINYLQPGLSTLLSRGLYDTERLRAEGMQRQNPNEYTELLKQKYISGIDVDRPAVISINMQISSMAMIELLNRLHVFKDEKPDQYAKVMIDYCGGCIENTSEEDLKIDEYASKWAGRGDCMPFLRMTDLK